MVSHKNSRATTFWLVFLFGVLACTEGATAVAISSIWRRHNGDGFLTPAEAAPLNVIGPAALVGFCIMAIAAAALTLGKKGHRVARFAFLLAAVRTAVVLVALATLWITIGSSIFAIGLARVGTAGATFGALVGLYVARVAVRQTKPIPMGT